MRYLGLLFILLASCVHSLPVDTGEAPVTVDDLVSRTVKISRSCPGGSVTGSGVILRGSVELGYKVATAEHVVKGFTNFGGECKVGVFTTDGFYPVSYAFMDAQRDVAVLTTFEGKYSPDVKFVQGQLGMPVIAVGFPYDKLKRKPQLSMSRGLIVTVYDGGEDTDEAYRISASIMPGSSGGGLWDTSGGLVGLTVSGFMSWEGTPLWDQVFATSSEGLIRLLQDPSNP